MKIERRYTSEGQDPFAGIAFRQASTEIRNPDGSVVFRNTSVEVPEDWSQVAADIIAQKYFRKAGVPARTRPVEEPDVPSWLWRQEPDEAAMADLPEDQQWTGESSARQVFHRLAGTWTYWGWKGGYFNSEADARAYYDESCAMLCRQVAAPNSPQWFNTGLHWAYGIDGPAQGHYHIDYRTGEPVASVSAYEYPQPHACFIQSVQDDLVNEGGIMDLWVREAPPVQVRVRYRFELFPPARRGRTALRRRQVLRPDELSEDRRSCGRRHQVRRHHAPGGENGDRRYRSSRYRKIYRLEGDRGTESRRPGRRLEADQQAHEHCHAGLHPMGWQRR